MARGRGKLTPQDLEYMKIISTNINSLLSNRNYKQIDLSRGTGIPASTLTGYVKGSSLPIPGNVQKIADFFGVKKSEIDPRFKSPTSSINSSNIISTDAPNSTVQAITDTVVQLHPERQENVLGYAQSELDAQNSVQEEIAEYNSDKIVPLYPEDEQEEIELYGEASAGTGIWLSDESIETILYPRPVPKHDIALRVRGNSMEPLFQDGEIVFIKKTKNVNNGQIIIIIVNNEAYIKKLYKKNQEVKLISLNPDYNDIILTEYDQIEIVGTVIL